MKRYTLERKKEWNGYDAFEFKSRMVESEFGEYVKFEDVEEYGNLREKEGREAQEHYNEITKGR